MDKIVIRGGQPLRGTLPISGAKNAALPLMAACLLTEETLSLSNMPQLADIVTMRKLLAELGVAVEIETPADTPYGQIYRLTTGDITNTTAPYDLVRTMRASVVVLGPLLARAGRARVSLPGGCAIGTRPVDIHLDGLEKMGAEINLDGGYIEACVQGRLKGTELILSSPSVGATENLLMAATLAEGETRILNAAREPEVTDLANCLVAMGAQISGIGSHALTIQGVDALYGVAYAVLPDRIETGTYAVAAAITGGDVELVGTRADLLGSVITVFERTGVAVTPTKNGIRVARANGLKGADVMTEPFPGFPTDMQAQIMALMTIADGASMVTETIFENRFMHVPELARMGADINVHQSSAIIRGVPQLSGAEVMATDLRASSSLVLAGLAAKGETTINRVYHLDRGYEKIEAKLSACGADIERVR
ncbi:MAG: UDP-N-acetylglucosamine 1-carboxyvinyltransferase [Magnetospiraceae bacterium]